MIRSTSMTINSISTMWRRLARPVLRLRDDCRGVAATEFALVVPLMLVAFFGTIEFSSGVAVNRKVTIMTNTLANLTAQFQSVANSDLDNIRAASTGIMTPYSIAPLNSTISELYIDPTTHQARVQWSYGSSVRATSSIVTIPSQLQIDGTYLIFTEVNYRYTPTIGYVMARTGVNLSDVAYTRPRQTTCVIYPTPASGSMPACPTS